MDVFVLRDGTGLIAVTFARKTFMVLIVRNNVLVKMARIVIQSLDIAAVLLDLKEKFVIKVCSTIYMQ